jgi:acyl carrier protein
MHNQEISSQIRHFILEKFPLARQLSLADEDSLLDSGVVDSLGVLELAAFVEQQFAVEIGVDDLQPENFQSITRLAAMVRAKVQGVAVLAGE